MKLTVFYNGQFWVGVLEEFDEHRLKVVNHIFGAKPNVTEVYAFIQKHAINLLTQTEGVSDVDTSIRKISPKRLARLISKELQQKGVTTYAQEAIKLGLMDSKKERSMHSREQQRAKTEQRREKAVQKKKEKRRGK